MKSKQVLAILCIFLLVLMYAVTFIFAIMDSPHSGQMFQSALFATIAVPILLWIYLQCIINLKERKKNKEDGLH